MKRLFLILTLLLLPVLVHGAGTVTITGPGAAVSGGSSCSSIGYQTAGSTAATHVYSASYPTMSPITVSGTGCKITKLEINIQADTGAADFKIALFNNNTPADRLDSGCTKTHAIGTGWISCSITGVSVTNGQTINVSSAASDNAAITAYSDNTSSGWYTVETWATFPATTESNSGTWKIINARVYLE